MGESCFILPNDPNIKDPNNFVKTIPEDYIPDDYINKHTYTGKLGLAKLRMGEHNA